MKDLRSPLAKARDEWIESPEGTRLLNSLGLFDTQFIQNRLSYAFVAGWNACKKRKSKRKVDKH